MLLKIRQAWAEKMRRNTNLIGDFPRQEQYLLDLSALIPKDE